MNSQSQSAFHKTQLAAGLWRIHENVYGTTNMYLVLGEQRALLIDTGTGAADLGHYVKAITQLPVLVVNTHRHGDHTGGNRFFEKIFIHPADLAAVKKYRNRDQELTPVEEGHLFELGGSRLAVLESPGHTAGSICLWDAARKILFTGDNNNTVSWLFLEESLPLEAYQTTLEKLIQRAGDFEVLYPGHGAPCTPAYLNGLAACARRILRGDCRGEPYQPSYLAYTRVRACTYQNATIAFNPDKLFLKK